MNKRNDLIAKSKKASQLSEMIERLEKAENELNEFMKDDSLILGIVDEKTFNILCRPKIDRELSMKYKKIILSEQIKEKEKRLQELTEQLEEILNE